MENSNAVQSHACRITHGPVLIRDPHCTEWTWGKLAMSGDGAFSPGDFYEVFDGEELEYLEVGCKHALIFGSETSFPPDMLFVGKDGTTLLRGRILLVAMVAGPVMLPLQGNENPDILLRGRAFWRGQ